MKCSAVAIVAKEQAELVDVPAPEPLGANDLRGPTLGTLVSPGTELASSYLGSKFPSFPGYAAVFVAEEIGPKVEAVSPGDLCFCMGPHRSYQQEDADAIRVIPAGLKPDHAVLARLMGVSMTTLMSTAARPGDHVVVSGAGPVGFLASQLFAFSGYRVSVVEPDAVRRGYVEQAGISHVYAAMPGEDDPITGTVALVVECSGHEQAVLDACNVVRKRGEVVLVGVPWQRRTSIYAQELISRVFFKFVVLRSGWEWQLPLNSADFNPHSIQSNFEAALRWLADGRVAVDKLIAHADPQDAQSVYQDLLHRRRQGLFTVFDWAGSTSRQD